MKANDLVSGLNNTLLLLFLQYAMSAAFQLGLPEMVGTEDAKKIKEEILKIQDGMQSNIQINLPPFTWYKALKVLLFKPKLSILALHSYVCFHKFQM
jgi:hypothetical protein